MKASDIMTKYVYTLKPDDPAQMFADMICRLGVAGAPVVDDDDRLVGIVSEKDLLKKMFPSYGTFLQSPGESMDFEKMEENCESMGHFTVRDIMTANVITAPPETPVLKLASTMILKRVRRIPIVDGGKLVGLVSQGDVHRAVFRCRLGE